MIMPRERYIAKANQQLCDSDVYQQLSNNMFFDVVEEGKDIFFRLQRSWFITENILSRIIFTFSQWCNGKCVFEEQ